MAWVQRWASGEQNLCCWAADICPGSFTCMQPSSLLPRATAFSQSDASHTASLTCLRRIA